MSHRPAELGVDVTGPSIPACLCVATILALSGSRFRLFSKSQSAGRRLCYIANMGCAGTSAAHTYLLLSCLDQHGAGSTTGTTQVALAPRLFTCVCYSALSGMFCLWNALVPRCHIESLDLTGLAPKIPGEPPGARLLWHMRARTCVMRTCAYMSLRAHCLHRAVSGSWLSRLFRSSGRQATLSCSLIRPSRSHLVIRVVCLERSVRP